MRVTPLSRPRRMAGPIALTIGALALGGLAPAAYAGADRPGEPAPRGAEKPPPTTKPRPIAPAAPPVGNFGATLATTTWALPTGDAGLIAANQGPDFGQGGIVSWNGALWFAEEKAAQLGRITPEGQLVELAMPASGVCGTPEYGPNQLSTAEGANLWILAGNGPLDSIACRYNGAANAADVAYDISGYLDYESITATPDGGAWITYDDGEGVSRYRPSTGQWQYFGDPAYSSDVEATLGPDGALWFSDGSGVIKRLTEAGQQTNFPATGDGGYITSMTTSGGNIWYSKFSPGSWLFSSREGIVARMSPAGVPTPFPSPYENLIPAALIPAADGGVWFTTHHGGGIGHVSPAGEYQVALMPEGQSADSVAVGPDGNLWFTDTTLNRVGRVTLADFASSIGTQTGPPPPGAGGVALGTKAVKLKKGKLPFSISCAAGSAACEGTVTVKKGKKVLAKTTYALPPGATENVVAKATKKGKKYFKTRRKAKVAVVLAGGGGEVRGTVTVKNPKAKKNKKKKKGKPKK